MKQHAQHKLGFWQSNWSAELAAQASAELMELQASANYVFWTEYSPVTGNTLLYSAQVDDKQPQRLTPEYFSVRSKVNEYGGASFTILDDQHWLFINESDQQIYLQRRDSLACVVKITNQSDCRYADVIYDASTHSIIAIEQQQLSEVIHSLVCFTLDANFNCLTRSVIQQGADFYSSPTLSTNQLRFAWIEWNRPNQPWTQTRLCCSNRAEATIAWNAPEITQEIIAGEQGAVALQQPSFDKYNRVLALNDANGFWQPYQQSTELGFTQITNLAADCAGAPWQMGGCNYLNLNQHELLLTWFEQGFGHCGIYSIQQKQITRKLITNASRIRHLACNKDYFFAIASYPNAGSAVILIDRVNYQETCIKQLPIGLNQTEISQPQAITVKTNQHAIHAFFFEPRNSAYSSKASQYLKPLVIFLHGGPTSAAYPVFDPRIQFWTQRGFAVVDINYSGSTSFGRVYRYSLENSWGKTEVEDIYSVVQFLIETAKVNPQQIVIRGASAGGYSALMALVDSDLFAAAASLYGVTDPINLRKATHKFESDYLDWLLGDPIQRAAYYQAHSPIYLANKISTPVIFFQGALDVVVIPEQTQHMVQQLQRNQIRTEYHEYLNQGHGFRDSRILADVMQRELEFYQNIFTESESG